MKTTQRHWTRLLATLALGAGLAQAADATLFFGTRPGSKVTVEGTSTIHDWKVEGAIISGGLEVCPAFFNDKSLKSTICLGEGKAPKVEISIPVRSLHSTVAIAADKMDAIMQEAMRMAENPKIYYKAAEMKIKGTVPETGSPVVFETKGQLAVSGVTNTISMEVTMERLDNDRLKFSGSKVLKMTDYKIKPPSPSLSGGMIKTGDEVTVKFELLTFLKKDAPK